ARAVQPVSSDALRSLISGVLPTASTKSCRIVMSSFREAMAKTRRIVHSAPIVPSRNRSRFDVAVVGGGHNGLVCAAYLAGAGRSVCVLERRSRPGGAAVTEEFAPGFRN